MRDRERERDSHRNLIYCKMPKAFQRISCFFGDNFCSFSKRKKKKKKINARFLKLREAATVSHEEKGNALKYIGHPHAQ